MCNIHVENFIEATQRFYTDLKNDENGRYRSWEHCYQAFYKARTTKPIDYDYLSLQLSFYLASWGMYRGSSFLLKKDYRVHAPIVKEIMKPEYDRLLGLTYEDLLDAEVLNLLNKLVKSLSTYYTKIRFDVIRHDVHNRISNTLITKILMGSLGCTPAYDKYFKLGITNTIIEGIGSFNNDSLNQLAIFYQNNVNVLEPIRHEMQIDNEITYPQMKLLDMGFWQIGIDNNQ